MNIVVDTDIIFSGVLTAGGKINQLLVNKPAELNYFSPLLLLQELENHKNKILSITTFSDAEYQNVKNFVLQEIIFVAANEIEAYHTSNAYNYLVDIDVDDTVFLALAFQKDALLWTGDKKLIKGLSNKPQAKIITTDILYSQYF